MSLVFRSGTSDDVEGAAILAGHSFPAVGRSTLEWTEWLLDSPLGGLETLWVGEDDGRLVAACQLYRFEQWIGGRTFPSMALGMVAISPTARRQGLAAKMCTAALRHSRDRGDLVSALYPFRASFYRGLGYGMAGEVHQYAFPPRDLPDSADRGKVTLVNSDEDRAAVARVYEQWAPTQTGQMVREGRRWERVWQEGTRPGFLWHGDGTPEGYAIVRYAADAPRGGRALEVEEIVWLSRRARLGLYGWIASLADQWDTVVYRAHPEEAFAEHLTDFRPGGPVTNRWHFWFSGPTTMMGPMFRLLDVQGGWARRTIRPGPPLTLALEVHDEAVPANGGAWRLEMVDGTVVASRGEGAADLHLAMTVDVLSRIFIGALAPSVAAGAGLLEGAAPEELLALDDLLRLPRPWTFDRF